MKKPRNYQASAQRLDYSRRGAQCTFLNEAGTPQSGTICGESPWGALILSADRQTLWEVPAEFVASRQLDHQRAAA
jgi:hypothetical protein